jgi:two-component system, sensor histidine kinase RegB
MALVATTQTPARPVEPAGAGDVRSWSLVRLRWGSAAGQFLIILVAWRAAGLALPVATLVELASLTAVTNAALWLWLQSGHPVTTAWIGSILAFDTLQLTGLLYVTDGASNPFSVFYLVQITAAASLLGSAWTWSLAALAVSCYAALFFMPAAPGDAAAEHMAQMMAGHLRAMWVALTLAAALSAYFATRLTAGLARRDREIAAMRENAARRDRLAAVTTLAAGAAHELATPLTTVAVVAGELQRSIAALPAETRDQLDEDIRLIRGEVVRCREILDSIGIGSGSATGEMPTRFTVAELLAETRARLHPHEASRVTAMGVHEAPAVFLPRQALVRALLSLLRNALEASPEGAGVFVEVEAGVEAGSTLSVTVRDRGCGMPPDVLARAGEPFFTTKPPGQGLGLGLFLARNLAEQLGGRFSIDSSPSRGTTAQVILPLEVHVDVR